MSFQIENCSPKIYWVYFCIALLPCFQNGDHLRGTPPTRSFPLNSRSSPLDGSANITKDYHYCLHSGRIVFLKMMFQDIEHEAQDSSQLSRSEEVTSSQKNMFSIKIEITITTNLSSIFGRLPSIANAELCVD